MNMRSLRVVQPSIGPAAALRRGSVQRLATIVTLTRYSMKPWGSLGRRATCHGRAGIGRDDEKRRQAMGVNTFVRAPKHEAIQGAIGSVRSRPECTAFTCLRTACCATIQTPDSIQCKQAGILYVQIHHTEAQCVSHDSNTPTAQPARTATRIRPLASSVSAVLAISSLVNQAQEPSICCFLRTSSPSVLDMHNRSSVQSRG